MDPKNDQSINLLSALLKLLTRIFAKEVAAINEE